LPQPAGGQMKFKDRHFVSNDELTRDEVEYIMRKSAEFDKAIEAGDQGAYSLAENLKLMMSLNFFEPSSRTEQSFLTAMHLMGVLPLGVSSAPGNSYSFKGESLYDAMRMFREYRARIAVIRHRLDGSARFIADEMDKLKDQGQYFMGIINGGDGTHKHPSQTIVDRYTILKFFNRLTDECDHPYSLRGLRIMMVNDLRYGRVPHSDVEDFSHDGVHFVFVAPEGMQMPESYLRLIEERGSTYEVHYGLTPELMSLADVVMVLRAQLERMGDLALAEYERTKKLYFVTEKLVKHMKPTAILTHPLPIYRHDPEIEPAVARLPQAKFYQQAGTGVPTRITILCMLSGLIGDDFDGELYNGHVIEEDVYWQEREYVARDVDDKDFYIKPIRKNGVVIDHLPIDTPQKLMWLLQVEKNGDVYRGGVIERTNHPGTYKGMLLVQDRYLTGEEKKIVASLVAGRLTNGRPTSINKIVEGVVTEKHDIVRVPAIITGQGKCKNIISRDGKVLGGCISREEFHEHVPARFVRDGDTQYRCYYCDYMMDAHQLYE